MQCKFSGDQNVGGVVLMGELWKLWFMENSYLEEKLEALLDGHLHVSSHCSAAFKKCV